MNACSGSFDTERQTLESGNLGRKPCAVYLLSQLFDDGFRHVINTSQNRRGDLSEVTVEYRNSIRRHTRILDCCTPYTLRRRLRKLKGAYRIVVLRETFGSTLGQQRWLSLIGAIPIVIHEDDIDFLLASAAQRNFLFRETYDRELVVGNLAAHQSIADIES